MKEMSKTVQKFGQSIFTTISQMAHQYGAINLSQGMPDFDGPLIPRQAASDAILQAKNQQSPAHGLLNFREQIAELYQNYYQLSYCPNQEITITCGATEGLMSSFLAILNPGDEVIVFEPFFDTYLPAIEMCGAIPKVLTLRAPTFSIDFDELENAIGQRTKAILLNFPHNPTGKVLPKHDAEKLAAIAIKNDLYILSDEVYQFLVFDNEKHRPLASYPGLKERTFTISSTGKTLGLTGWRLGWVAAPIALTEAVRLVHQNITFAAARPLQEGASVGLKNLADYLPQFVSSYQQKRDYLYYGLKECGFAPLLPQSSYFILAPVPTKEDDVSFVKKLIHEAKVAAIPCSAFYTQSNEGRSWLRFCFAKEQATLEEAIHRLKSNLHL